jgi:hypothetical protein
MSKLPSPPCSPVSLTNDLLSFHALFMAIIRFAVEKYGGNLRKDPATGTTYVDIPDWAEDACLQELGALVGPGSPLNGYLSFLQD